MSFETILRTVLDESGGLGIALMGNDGIAIEQLAGAGAAVLQGDIATAGAEFARILDEVRKASDALGGGGLSETVVSLAGFSLIFQSVDAELFVVLAVPPDGNLGKARYLLRRQLVAIRFEL